MVDETNTRSELNGSKKALFKCSKKLLRKKCLVSRNPPHPPLYLWDSTFNTWEVHKNASRFNTEQISREDNVVGVLN